MNKDKLLQYLIMNLKIVSAKFEEQVECFPEFVVIPDEIAINYGEAFLLFEYEDFSDRLSENVIKKIRDIRMTFSRMSSDKSIWNIESLEKHPMWEKQRKAAQEVLEEMDIDYSEVKLPKGITYIPSKPKENN